MVLRLRQSFPFFFSHGGVVFYLLLEVRDHIQAEIVVAQGLEVGDAGREPGDDLGLAAAFLNDAAFLDGRFQGEQVFADTFVLGIGNEPVEFSLGRGRRGRSDALA